MENVLSVLFLALIQGVFEWLPISSSGHILLGEKLTGFSGGLLLEVALHFGTLMAVFAYFGKEISSILQDVLLLKITSPNFNLAISLFIATIPAVIAGFFLARFFDTILSDLRITAMGFAITGTLLFIASFYRVPESRPTYTKAFLIGCAQVFALIPGISRAGTTLSASLLLGLKEQEAMRFSFLMAIPVTFGASIFVLGLSSASLESSFIYGTLLSFFVALLVLHLIYTRILVNRANLKWFSIYCWTLSAILFILYFTQTF